MTGHRQTAPSAGQGLRFRNWRISSKILIVMLLVALIPLVLATFFIVRNSQRALTRETEINLALLSRSMALRFAHMLNDHLDFLRLAAMNPALAAFTESPTDEARKARQPVADETVASLLAASPGVDVVGIYSPEGVTLAHTDPGLVGRNVSGRDFIRSALEGRAYVSGLRRDLINGTLGVNISAPVLENGKVVGAVALRVGGDFLSSVYSETIASESGAIPAATLRQMEMLVADPHNVVLANSADPADVGYVLGALTDAEREATRKAAPLGTECPADKPECTPAERIPLLPVEYAGLQQVGAAANQALQTNQVSSVRYCLPNDPAAAATDANCTQEWRVAAVAPVRALLGADVTAPDDLFSVIVDTPEALFLEAANRQRNLALAIAGLTALGAVLGSWLLARALARPINTLAHTARHIEHGEPYHPEELATVTNRYDELGDLSRALSSMVAAQEARLNELNMIYDLGRQVTSSVNVDETLRFLADAIRPIIPYDAIEISVRQGPGSGLMRQYAGNHGVSSEQVNYPEGAGLIGKAVSQADGLRIDDLAHEPAPGGEPPRTWDGLPPRSYLGVPLQVNGQTMGVVELVSRSAGAFSEQQQRLLTSISLQAAVAIQNASAVRVREQQYEKQIMELNIEIDEMKRAQQVGEIVESEYFQSLSAQAQKLRSQRKRAE